MILFLPLKPEPIFDSEGTLPSSRRRISFIDWRWPLLWTLSVAMLENKMLHLMHFILVPFGFLCDFFLGMMIIA